MAETVSDKDVEKTRSRVEKLREQIADEKSKASVIADEGANAVRQASLEREAEVLEAELAMLKEANKPANVKAVLADATETPEEQQPMALIDPDNEEK